MTNYAIHAESSSMKIELELRKHPELSSHMESAME
jgi:hypothetical protein